MNKFPRTKTTALERAESANPLWAIAIVMAIFFGAAAILIAWG